MTDYCILTNGDQAIMFKTAQKNDGIDWLFRRMKTHHVTASGEHYIWGISQDIENPNAVDRGERLANEHEKAIILQDSVKKILMSVTWHTQAEIEPRRDTSWGLAYDLGIDDSNNNPKLYDTIVELNHVDQPGLHDSIRAKIDPALIRAYDYIPENVGLDSILNTFYIHRIPQFYSFDIEDFENRFMRNHKYAIEKVLAENSHIGTELNNIRDLLVSIGHDITNEKDALKKWRKLNGVHDSIENINTYFEQAISDSHIVQTFNADTPPATRTTPETLTNVAKELARQLMDEMNTLTSVQAGITKGNFD